MKQLIFISIILLALSSCQKEKKLLEEIYDEPAYAIGTINSSISGTFAVQYNYSFYVGSTKYKGNKKEGGLNPSNSSIIGCQYLVVYKISEPKKNDLNYKYPIYTEQDFLDLLEEFKTNPPKP